MASPVDPKYLSRRQMEDLVSRAMQELQGSLLLFTALVAKVGPVELTYEEVTSADTTEVTNTPIDGGFRISTEPKSKE